MFIFINNITVSINFFSPFTPSSQDKPLAVVLIQLNFENRLIQRNCTFFLGLGLVLNNRLFILPVKFTQNRKNKQRHFYSTGKIARKLSKSIIAWNIWRNLKILSGLCAQQQGVSAVIQWPTPQKYCNVFKDEVHVAPNLRLCTVKFYLF